MIKVMFVCLGNICRSPMAECVMSHLIKESNLEGKIEVASSATSFEEIGNPIYPPTQRKLRAMGIEVLDHRAVRITPKAAKEYDYILGMEERNVRAIKQIIGNEARVSRLLDFSPEPRDIADPWWTGNFDITYDDILEGCECLLEHIKTHDLKIR